LYQKINNENDPILITKIVPPQEKMIKAVVIETVEMWANPDQQNEKFEHVALTT